MSGVSTPDLATMLRPLLLRVTRNMRSQRVDTSITLSELSALHSLGTSGPMTARDLAAMEAVRPPSMTKVLAKLEAQELIHREPDPSDKRQSLLVITNAGSDLVESENQSRATWLTQQLTKLTQEELMILSIAAPVLAKIADI
jgi:DNA-binding MarR family transcriptional regulator